LRGYIFSIAAIYLAVFSGARGPGACGNSGCFYYRASSMRKGFDYDAEYLAISKELLQLSERVAELKPCEPTNKDINLVQAKEYFRQRNKSRLAASYGVTRQALNVMTKRDDTFIDINTGAIWRKLKEPTR
jgi:hypothetical protein